MVCIVQMCFWAIRYIVDMFFSPFEASLEISVSSYNLFQYYHLINIQVHPNKLSIFIIVCTYIVPHCIIPFVLHFSSKAVVYLQYLTECFIREYRF